MRQPADQTKASGRPESSTVISSNAKRAMGGSGYLDTLALLTGQRPDTVGSVPDNNYGVYTPKENKINMLPVGEQGLGNEGLREQYRSVLAHEMGHAYQENASYPYDLGDQEAFANTFSTHIRDKGQIPGLDAAYPEEGVFTRTDMLPAGSLGEHRIDSLIEANRSKLKEYQAKQALRNRILAGLGLAP